jgi:hypothetical protein
MKMFDFRHGERGANGEKDKLAIFATPQNSSQNSMAKMAMKLPPTISCYSLHWFLCYGAMCTHRNPVLIFDYPDSTHLIILYSFQCV